MSDYPTVPSRPTRPAHGELRIDYTSPDPGAAPEGGGLSVGEILGVLRRQRWIVLAAVALSLAGTMFLLSRQAKLYRATALIRLRGPAAAAQASGAEQNVVKTDPILSELAVLQGRGVAGEVVDREGLRLVVPETGASPELADSVAVTLPAEAGARVRLRFGADRVSAVAGAERREAPYGSPVLLSGIRFILPHPPEADSATWVILPRDVAIDGALAGLGVRSIEGTDGLQVAYTASDPARAVDLVNGFVRAYQDVNRESAQQETTRRQKFLESQLRETDSLTAVTQAALSELRARVQAYSTQQKFTEEQGELAQLKSERASLEADRRLYRSLLQGLSKSSGSRASSRAGVIVSLPALAANPAITRLAQQLVQYEQARDSLALFGRTVEHPAVKQLTAAIDSTTARLVQAISVHLASIDERIRLLEARGSSSAGSLQSLASNESVEANLVQRLETLRSIGSELRHDYETVRIARAVEAGQVEIVHLASGAMPAQDRNTFKLVLGLVFGLLVGAGGAFAREAANTSIRRREDVQERLRIPVMGVIPQMPLPRKRLLAGPRGRLGARKPQRLDPSGSAELAVAKEAYRVLRNNLLFSQQPPTGATRSLAVTSSSAGDGKTTTAMNLACTVAEQGLRVVLVSCDFRRPRLEKQLGISRQPGLTDVLLQETSLEEALQPVAVPNLVVLPCGSPREFSTELLAGQRMDHTLLQLEREFDLVILDSPPLLAASEASVLAAKADGVLLVLRAGTTERDAAHLAMEQLGAVGARVVGAVLNDPDAEVGRYDRQYRYHYQEMSEYGGVGAGS